MPTCRFHPRKARQAIKCPDETHPDEEVSWQDFMEFNTPWRAAASLCKRHDD
jgi:hypothetical protein